MNLLAAGRFQANSHPTRGKDSRRTKEVKVDASNMHNGSSFVLAPEPALERMVEPMMAGRPPSALPAFGRTRRKRRLNGRPGYDFRAKRLLQIACLLVLTIGCGAWVAPALAQDHASFDAVDLDSTLAVDKLVAQLATKRIVFIGEIHDRYDHHLNQLDIIQRLHQIDPNMAIGVEYFQQPFQPQVDDYIAGQTTENEFLGATEYFQRWGFDYRLYAPIFRYAREQRIPVRALNVPAELTSAVARAGIAGLSAKQRAYLPKEIEPADDAYQSRLREAFADHPGLKPDGFKKFVEAQLVWDEGMAESAAAYLNANPGRRMVILAGAGHIEFGTGIPKRLERRTKATYAIVLSSGEEIEPHIADYLLLSRKQELPPAGVLAIAMKETGGECRIASLSPGGAGEKAGLKKGDVLVAIGGQTIKTIAQVQLALWDKKPGDRVHVNVRRKRFLRAPVGRDFEIELAAPPNTAGSLANAGPARPVVQ